MRLTLALRCFWKALGDASFADRVEPLLEPPKVVEKKPSGEPVRLLALLQRDGRLVDFLREDIGGYSDAEVGAAVRDIHRDCQATLDKYVELVPVLAEEEGSEIAVPEGFDPETIRLTGSVKGSAPFRGTVEHRGWRVKTLRMPETAADQDDLLIAPAEVEIP